MKDRVAALEKRATDAEVRLKKLELDSVKYDVRTEMICLRRDVEAMRATNQKRYDNTSKLIADYRAEVCRFGSTAATIAVETKAGLTSELHELSAAMDRRTAKLFAKIDDLAAMLGAKGHA